jgi:spore germination cell wall hydrolase CwlJ-like protein
MQLYNRRTPEISKTKIFRVYIPILILAFSLIQLASVNLSYNDKILDIKYSQLTKESQQQIDCLAQNIYHEAGFEPEDGKLAVALVTMNRVQDPRYPKDICGVVKQKIKSTCQFTWFCETVKIKSEVAYNKALDVALNVYANYDKIQDITQGALFYHADYVNPRWKLKRTTVIGRHIFYKESDNKNDAKNEPTTKGRNI